MSVINLSAQDVSTHAGQWAIAQFSATPTAEIKDDQQFNIIFPATDKTISDAACFTFDKSAEGKITNVKSIKSKLVTKEKITSIQGDIKGPMAASSSLNVICQFKAPDVVLANTELIYAIGKKDATEGIATADNRIEYLDDRIADDYTFKATGDASKPGLTIKASKFNRENITEVGVADPFVDFSGVVDGSKCKAKVDGKSMDVTVSSGAAPHMLQEGVHSIQFKFPEVIPTKGSFSIECDKDAKIAAVRNVPGFPSIIHLFNVDGKADGEAGAHACALAQFENSALSMATGVAVVATAASLLAYLF